MTTILKKLLCLLVLSPALVVAESIGNNATRVLTTTKFEYKLDASNIPRYGSVQTVVDVIDSVIIDRMSQKLSPLEAAQLGDAVLDQVNSEIYSQCFGQGDECVLARSMLTISHNGEKSELSIQFAALRLVQDFLKDFNTSYVDVSTTYMFPKIMQHVAQFDIRGVDIHLKPDNMEIFRATILEVYGDALTAKQRDMNLLDVQYIYQKRVEDKLETHFMISARCRSCTERSFKYTLGTIFDESKEQFQMQLRSSALVKGSFVVAGVTEVDYTWPEEPEFLDSLDETFFVQDISQEVSKEIPWWIIWIGVGLLLVALGLGILLFSIEDMRPWETRRKPAWSNASDTSSDNSNHSRLSISVHELEDDDLDGSNRYEKYNVGSPSNSDGTTYSI
ncbi:MAG: hypothetical protein SGBAC_010716 [Bacillariaceae sp.]